MQRTITTLAILVLLTACQTAEKESQPSLSSTQTEPLNSNAEKNTPHFKKLPCTAHKSPPIYDKSKIKEMLISSGKIDANGSTEEINKAVNEFIKNKQKTVKNCQ